MRHNLFQLLTLFCFFLLIVQPIYGQVIMPKKGLCAHRGCMNTHPENTLPAFKEAIRLGAHMIELDIQFTKDNVPILMHDETVDRTTNGTGKVSEMTFAKIRRLDAGIRKSIEFEYTAVPTFEEILNIMPRNVWLNCHLKGEGEAGSKIAKIIQKAGRIHQAFITCGESAAKSARGVVLDILICNVEDSYRKYPEEYVNNSIALKANFIQLVKPITNESIKPLMEKLHKNGLKANFFYAKDIRELGQLYESGVDFVLVNELAEFMKEAESLGINRVQPH